MSLYSWSQVGNRWMTVKPGNVWVWSVTGNRWMRIISMKSWSVGGNRWLEIFPDPTVADLYERTPWENAAGRKAKDLANISTTGGTIYGGTTVKKGYGINNMIRRLTGVKIQARFLGGGNGSELLRFYIETTAGRQGNGRLSGMSFSGGMLTGWLNTDTRDPIFALYIANIGSDSGDGMAIGDVKPIEFRFAD